jgi:hypothetical protein
MDSRKLLDKGIKFTQIMNKNKYPDIIDNLQCVMCLNLVLNPMECHNCEVLFCEECYELLKISGQNCVSSTCKETIKKANKFVREILSNFFVSCSFCGKGEIKYDKYIEHINNCYIYQNSSETRDFYFKKIEAMQKEIDEKQKRLNLNNKKESSISQIDPGKMSIEEIRNQVMTFNLPVNKKMDLYNAAVNGNIGAFKKLIEKDYYPMNEEVSAHGYYWTPLHYAMHYGKEDIIMFILNRLTLDKKLSLVLKLESNDGRCPFICLLRSNGLQPENKKLIFKSIMSKFPFIELGPNVIKEIKTRKFDDLLVFYNDLNKKFKK